MPPTCTEAGENETAADRKVLVAAGCYTIDVQVAMLRLLFFARLVQRCTAPLFAVLQAGDGHATSWTTALRRDFAWLDKTEGCGEFSDPHDGDCSDWVAFARDKPAQWKTRVTRAAKASILSVEAFPVSGFAVQPAEMLTCGMPWHRWLEGVHGKRCESRLFAFGLVCRWCMTDFRTAIINRININNTQNRRQRRQFLETKLLLGPTGLRVVGLRQFVLGNLRQLRIHLVSVGLIFSALQGSRKSLGKVKSTTRFVTSALTEGADLSWSSMSNPVRFRRLQVCSYCCPKGMVSIDRSRRALASSLVSPDTTVSRHPKRAGHRFAAVSFQLLGVVSATALSIS